MDVDVDVDALLLMLRITTTTTMSITTAMIDHDGVALLSADDIAIPVTPGTTTS
jgi:hypothetical protein